MIPSVNVFNIIYINNKNANADTKEPAVEISFQSLKASA